MRKEAELEHLGIRVHFIYKDAFWKPQDAVAVHELRFLEPARETNHLRVMEVFDEGLVRKRNKDIGKTSRGEFQLLLPGD